MSSEPRCYNQEPNRTVERVERTFNTFGEIC